MKAPVSPSIRRQLGSCGSHTPRGGAEGLGRVEQGGGSRRALKVVGEVVGSGLGNAGGLNAMLFVHRTGQEDGKWRGGAVHDVLEASGFILDSVNRTSTKNVTGFLTTTLDETIQVCEAFKAAKVDEFERVFVSCSADGKLTMLRSNDTWELWHDKDTDSLLRQCLPSNVSFTHLLAGYVNFLCGESEATLSKLKGCFPQLPAQPAEGYKKLDQLSQCDDGKLQGPIEDPELLKLLKALGYTSWVQALYHFYVPGGRKMNHVYKI